jgi:hypothetical protein
MRRTRKLCAIILDTLGREVMIRRPFRIDPDGWPNQAGQEIEIKAGQRITLTTRGEPGVGVWWLGQGFDLGGEGCEWLERVLVV